MSKASRKFQVKFYADESNIYDQFSAVCQQLGTTESSLAKVAIASMIAQMLKDARALQESEGSRDEV